MTDSPHGACPPPGHGPWSTHPTPYPGPREHSTLLRLEQRAPRGVDVQDLRPLRGRPCGPILDPDAYPGAPTTPAKNRQKKDQSSEHEVDRHHPFRDDLHVSLNVTALNNL